MEDIYNFYELVTTVDFKDLSWGWKAFCVYGLLFIIFALLSLFQTIVGCIVILFRIREVPAEDIFQVLRSNSIPPITFVVPAYNERKNIVQTAKNMLSLSYRYKQVIIVNDGSTDNTLDLLLTNFDLKPLPPSCSGQLLTAQIRNYYASEKYPNLLVIDKVNAGKADALNAGINVCTSEILVCADADTLVEDRALNRLVRPFLMHPDTVAAHASIGNVNGCTIAENRIVKYNFPKRLLLGFQVVEFMKAFLVERLGLSWTKGSLVIPGNFGMFKLSTLIEIGGYDRTSIIEDTEIITRLHKYLMEQKRQYRITYVSDIVAWTEAPENLPMLAKQRLRWYKGTTQNIWQYRGMIFNPKYRSVGMFVCPMTALEKIAPLIELSGFVILGAAWFYSEVDIFLVFGLAAVSWCFAMILIFIALIVEFLAYATYPTWRDFGRILRCVSVYTVYHYMLLWWRLRGLYAPKPKRAGWTPLRTGYEEIQETKHTQTPGG
jgi:cellulose synthase/poly-beta-1,6-N-acetylglucosamine synthase-like glycosyltransferase